MAATFCRCRRLYRWLFASRNVIMELNESLATQHSIRHTHTTSREKERTIHCHKCLEGAPRNETEREKERKDLGHTYHPHHPASVAKICYERRVRSLVCMCGSVDWSVSYLMFIYLLLGSLLIGIPRCLCVRRRRQAEWMRKQYCSKSSEWRSTDELERACGNHVDIENILKWINKIKYVQTLIGVIRPASDTQPKRPLPPLLLLPPPSPLPRQQ